jgi:hypothetical protein
MDCTRWSLENSIETMPQVIFRQLEVIGAESPDRALLRKITPSLVTLLAAEPEIQCALVMPLCHNHGSSRLLRWLCCILQCQQHCSARSNF